ncbi:hypothetical protein SAMN02799626_03376 [Caulobacter sp. UNC279MFTsu5.1]|nr:hypothetical protein SAMN02799626_03376 [Caulobacter sp. UNC279MFTsu5.1]
MSSKPKDALEIKLGPLTIKAQGRYAIEQAPRFVIFLAPTLGVATLAWIVHLLR